MFARAVLAFLALPGIVAYVVPIILAPERAAEGAWRGAGSALITAGSLLLLWCVREFHVNGRGTLAPWSPPTHLVTTGLYRWSRNPMYVSVLLVVLGWAVLHRSPGLLMYLAGLAVAFQLRIVLYEEPRLSAGFGDEWDRYRQRAPRWILPVR